MNAWTGNGPTPPFTLTDDEVLALMRTVTPDSTLDPNYLVSGLTVWRKLEARAEDILNEQRAARR